MNQRVSNLAEGWHVHGLDYYGPCWPVGGGRFLFSRKILGAWGDARLDGSRGQCRLSIRLPRPDADWVLGLAEHDLGSTEGVPVAAPSGAEKLFVSGWDPDRTCRADLPAPSDGQPWLAFNGEGAIAALFSGHRGQWQIQDPSDLLRRVQSGEGEELSLPTYQPFGVPALVEAIIQRMAEDPVLTRRGRRCWKIRRGSATLFLCYSEDRALLSAEVHLVRLGPDTRRRELMAFLLQENVRLSGYGFSLQEDRVVIALVLPARFLREEGTARLLTDLLVRSDVYDNTLVSRFGADWLRP